MNDKVKDTITLPHSALTALQILEDAGFEAWCVGGFVRDSLMKRPTSDIDIASSAPWEEVQSLFENAGYKTFETGVKHGTLTVIVADQILEITTYRHDGDYSDMRHPDSVTYVRSIEEDLARRDFTINAIAFHPERGLCDPYGGQRDIAEAIIRTVGDPSKRLSEDALRILRGCRFSSQLGFSLEAMTFQAMIDQKHLLGHIAVERIAHELDAFVCGDFVHDALLQTIEILGQVIPELLPMRFFDQKTPYHIYDVLEHTAYCMQHTPSYPLVRWAALFHDIGKPDAFFTDKAGVGHFYGHAKISVDIARTVMKRLKFPSSFMHDILLLVEHHDDTFPAKPKALKKMLRKLDERVDLLIALIDLKRGDAAAQAPQCHDRIDLADELKKTLAEILEAKEVFSLRDLAIKGTDVIALGVEPGPLIGELLEAALSAVIDEKEENDRTALLAYLEKKLHNHPFYNK